MLKLMSCQYALHNEDYRKGETRGEIMETEHTEQGNPNTRTVKLYDTISSRPTKRDNVQCKLI